MNAILEIYIYIYNVYSYMSSGYLLNIYGLAMENLSGNLSCVLQICTQISIDNSKKKKLNTFFQQKLPQNVFKRKSRWAQLLHIPSSIWLYCGILIFSSRFSNFCTTFLTVKICDLKKKINPTMIDEEMEGIMKRLTKRTQKSHEKRWG